MVRRCQQAGPAGRLQQQLGSAAGRLPRVGMLVSGDPLVAPALQLPVKGLLVPLPLLARRCRRRPRRRERHRLARGAGPMPPGGGVIHREEQVQQVSRHLQ